MKKIACAVLSFIMAISMVTGAFAADSTYSASSNSTFLAQISWEQLPIEYQEIIQRDAIIYENSDGTYDIFQDNPIANSPRSFERYEPNGGTYSDFSNSKYSGSNLIYLVYQTYMPANKVGQYLVQNQTSVLDSAIQWVAAYGITKALTLLASTYGIHISSEALNLAVSSAIVYFSSYSYNQMMTASGGGQYGVQIDYITTIGAGNSRVYSKWSGAPYVLREPNGGTASWAPGQYYAAP